MEQSVKSLNPLKIEKWKLAEIIGISDNTLRILLNCTYFEELKTTGYRPSQKLLYRRQLNVVFPDGIDFEYDNK